MRVPELEQTDVAPEAMPTPYNQTSDAPVASAIAGLGAKADAIKEHFTAVRVADAQNKLSAAIDDAQWNPKPQTTTGDISAAINQGPNAAGGPSATAQPTGSPAGFMLRRGKDAIDPSAHFQALDDARAKIQQSLLDSPDALQAFNMRSAGMLATAHRQAEEHSGQQMRAVSLETANATWDAALRTVGLLHPTPNTADPTGTDSIKRDTASAVERAIGPMVNQMRAEGMPDAAIEEAIKDKKEKAYGLAVTTLIDDWNGTGARALYEKVEPELGKDAPRLNKLIIRAERRQQRGLNAGAAVQAGLNPDTKWVDLGKGLDFINSKYGDESQLSPEEAEAKSQDLEHFKQRAAAQNEAAQQYETDTVATLKGKAREHPGGIEVPDTYTGPDSSKPLFETLRPKAQEELRAWVDDQQRKAVRDQRGDDEAARRLAMEARRDARDAERLKNEKDSAAYRAFHDLPLEERAKERSPDEWKQEFPDASGPALKNLGGLQRGYKDTLDKGDIEQQREFDKQVSVSLQPLPGSKQEKADMAASMERWYFQQKAANGGKAPTKKDVAKELADRSVYQPKTTNIPLLGPTHIPFTGGAPRALYKAREEKAAAKTPTPGAGSPEAQKPASGTTGAKPPQQVLDAQSWLKSDAAKKNPDKAAAVQAKLKKMGY